ncbi:hypothetical protein ACIPH4_11060 [Streptomyces tendae]|uniref:hypothetical protein n=1 Tax=Streptomyces tendae TaxID=1932 RepID=UPI00380A6407
MTAAEHATNDDSRAEKRPTIDDALVHAARCLSKAEDALPETAGRLNETASHWIDMANLLLARSMPIR